MNLEFHCAECNKHVATVRDARIRNGVVMYCPACNERNREFMRRMKQVSDCAPDFFAGLNGKGREP